MNRPGSKSALVTGGTGALGPVVIKLLLEQGWEVRALVRTPPPSNYFPKDVDIRVGDVVDAHAVSRAVEGVSTVFHLAAVLHNHRPTPAQEGLYEAVNVRGTGNVAQAALLHGASVVHFSSIAVYGETPQGPVDEDAPVRPIGVYATSKRRAEEILLNAGIRVCVLRLAAVYGRRMKGNYRRLVDALAGHRFFPVGDGSNRRTLVHEGDAAQAALLAAARINDVEGVFNVTDGETHTMGEILAAICSALGRSEPRVRIPESLARLVGRGTGQSHVIEKYLESVEVKGERIQEVLGFSPQFDLAAGWRDAIQAWDNR